MENYLIHFGNKNSGRYPRGSGERPNQHTGIRSGAKLGAKIGVAQGVLFGGMWGAQKAAQAIARHGGAVAKGQYYAVGILGGATMEAIKGAVWGTAIGVGAATVKRMLGHHKKETSKNE